MSYGIFGTYFYLKILVCMKFKFNWASCILSGHPRQEKHWQLIACLGIQKPRDWAGLMGEVGVSEDRQVSGGSQEASSHPGSGLTAQRNAGRSSMESAHTHYMYMGAHHSHTSIPTQPRPSGQDANPSGASSVPWWSFRPLLGRWEAKPR